MKLRELDVDDGFFVGYSDEIALIERRYLVGFAVEVKLRGMETLLLLFC